MRRTKKPISLALLFGAYALTACGGSDDTPQVTVAFPDSMSDQAVHCITVLLLEDFSFRNNVEDAPLSWIEDDLIESYKDEYEPALQAATMTAIESGAAAPLMDLEVAETMAMSTARSFQGSSEEFGRHMDLCIEVFGPKD